MQSKWHYILFISFLFSCLVDGLAQPVPKRVPLTARYNPHRLAEHLADGCNNEEEKVRAFYFWITKNIRYDVKRFISGKSGPVKLRKILIRKRGLCADYANLFDTLCKSVGIKSCVVSGYSKGIINLDDDLLFINDHAWNAVFINGEWKLLDLTWASGNVIYLPTRWGLIKKKIFPYATIPHKHYYRANANDRYFLAHPKVMIKTHLPENPVWQLLNPALPIDVFEKRQNDIRAFVQQSYLHQESANTYSEKTRAEKNLITSDSVLLFNCRNALSSGVERYHAGEELFIEGAVSKDIHMLNKAFSCFDSSQKLLEESKLLIKEDFGYRNKKNLIRNALAKSDIKNIKNKSASRSKKILSIPAKDRASIRAYRQKNKQIQKEIYLLNLKNIDNVTYKKKPASARDKEYNIYYNEIVKLNTDTLLHLGNEIVLLYNKVNEQLLDSLQNLLLATDNTLKQISYATDNLLLSRAFLNSNLDTVVLLESQNRTFYSCTLDSIMEIRIQKMNELKSIQHEMNQRINQIKKLARQSAQYLREIKTRSNLSGKEDSLYRAQFNHVSNCLSIIYNKNKSITHYLIKQSDWAKQNKKPFKILQKKFRTELRYETIRFESRKALIQSRLYNAQKESKYFQKKARSRKQTIQTFLKK